MTMKTSLLLCLFLSGCTQAWAHESDVWKTHSRHRVWNAMQSLLLCYFDMAAIYSDTVIGPFMENNIAASDVSTLSRCAVEVGVIISTEFPGGHTTCSSSKAVMLAERLLSCSGMEEKFLHTLQSMYNFGHGKAINEGLLKHHVIDGHNADVTYASKERDTDTGNCINGDCKRSYSLDNDNTPHYLGTVDRDSAQVHAGDIIGDIMKDFNKVGRSNKVRHPDERSTYTDQTDSESKKEKKKQKQLTTSWCSWRDILEGAGRGFIGGTFGGYMGGGKLGGVVGSGSGLVAGGVAGCFYGGYHGGVIGGSIGGGVGGVFGRTGRGIKSALKGGVGGGAAGVIIGYYMDGWTGAVKGGIVGGASGAALGYMKEVSGGMLIGSGVGGSVAGVGVDKFVKAVEYVTEKITRI